MIFLRHPRPDVDPGICYGRLDIDIHADGHDQIAKALEQIEPAASVLASPAKRCRKLALAVAEHSGLDPQFDDRLWEMDMGEWEGMPWKEIPPERSSSWLDDPFNLSCPGGESFRQLQERVLDALSHADPNTIVICHAGPIRAVQMAWLGWSFKEAFAQAPAFAEPVCIVPDDVTSRPTG